MEAGLLGVYAIKVTICLLLFFIFNKLLLSRETFHTLNRFIWLFVVVASLGLPLMEWTVVDEQVVVDIPMLFDMEEIAIPEELEVEPLITLEGVASSLFFLYVSVVVILLVRMAILYLRLFSLILRKKSDLRRSILNSDMEYVALFERCEQQLGICREIHYVVHDHNIAPFSWMNYIVISREDLAENGHDIIIHELSHVKHYHSWDLLFIELVTIFQWYNPASWLTKRELQQVHEYAADESVLNVGVNAKEYQLLLIKKAVGQRLYSMTNSFNHSKLKKRITMMLKKKSSKWAVAKSLYALPLAFFAVAAFANPEMSNRFDEISEVKVINFFENDQTTEDVITQADSIPDKKPLYFVDGQRYDGDINDIDPSTIKHVNVYKGESAKIYGQGSENGVIVVELKDSDSSKKDDTHAQTTNATIVNSGSQEDKMTSTLVSVVGFNSVLPSEKTPLYIVDGITVDDITDIDATTIESMSVIKGEAAKEYGVGSENGVILITLKDGDTEVEKRDHTQPFLIAEKMPLFQGGDLNAFRLWVGQNLVVPKSTLEKGTECRAALSFIVERDGNISSVKVLQTADQEFAQAATTAIESSPTWAPAQNRGKAVRVKYTIPVAYTPEVVKSISETNTTEEPMMMAEVMPKFQDGDLNDFRTWVSNNLVIPKSTLEKGEGCRVALSFVVERDGSVSSVKVLQTADKEFAEATVKVMENSPRWTPAQSKGKAVSVKYVLPVDYRP